MKAFNILDPDLNVKGHHFLEASAGTGKTFAIEHLVVRLFMEDEKPVFPQEIIVMTFTRVAARELKERIFANCSKVYEQLLRGESTLPYVQKMITQGKAKEGARRLQRALSLFDRLRISTLHSFCARVLREHALDCHVPFSFKEVDEFIWMREIEQSLRQYLRSLNDSRYAASQLERVRAYYGPSDEGFIRTLIKLYVQHLSIPELPTFEEIYKKMQAFLFSCEGIQKVAFVEDFAALAPLYKQMSRVEFTNQAARLGMALENKACSSEEFAEWLGEKEWFFSKFDPQFRKKRAKEEPVFHYPNLFVHLKETLYPLIAQAADPKRIALRIVKDAASQINHMQEIKGVFSPDHIVCVLHNALSCEKITQCIRKQVRAVVIDEFQDTDVTQWEIVQRLFMQCETLYLVGDPKQSIYAFRNADLYTYLSAKDLLGIDAKKVLSTNFRATSQLVSALNAFFSPLRDEGGFLLPKEQMRIPIPPVVAGREYEEGSDTALHFFYARGTSAKAKTWPSQEMEQRMLFPFLLEQIRRIHKERGIALREIAVLVKDRYQAQRVLKFLDTSGISAHFKRGMNFGASRGLFLVIECVKAVMDPECASAMKSFLAGACARWNARELLECSLSGVQDRLRALQNILLTEGCACFFGALLMSSLALDGKIVEQKLLEDESVYREVRSVIEQCVKEPQLLGKDLLVWLRDLRFREESGTTREEGVSIMTVYVSKGLEFDTVFALGLASRHTTLEDWVRVDRILYPFEKEQPHCQRALEEAIAEKFRYAYVTLTRAKRELFVPVIFDMQKDDVPRIEYSPMELLMPGDEKTVFSWMKELEKKESVKITNVCEVALRNEILSDLPC